MNPLTPLGEVMDVLQEALDRSVTLPLLLVALISCFVLGFEKLLRPVERVQVVQEPDRDTAVAILWRRGSAATEVARFNGWLVWLILVGPVMVWPVCFLLQVEFRGFYLAVVPGTLTTIAPYLLGFTLVVVGSSFINRFRGGGRLTPGLPSSVRLPPGFWVRHYPGGEGLTTELEGQVAREEIRCMVPVPRWEAPPREPWPVVGEQK